MPYNISRKELIKKIKNLWFSGPFISWKHEYMINDSGFKIVIPNIHSGKDIGVDLLKAISKQLWIEREDFKNL